ncbi:MAG: tryptophan synthase subunit alpha [Chitinophagaceae bacterium]|nr:tryptophan synthase subunit alpha [Chitinophagaceae bacterium]
MDRIHDMFEAKKQRVLNVYCTAGYPQVENTLDVMVALQEAGVDMIEIGMPYSDPLADGPVIQQSGSVALSNGMTIEKLFSQLHDFRKKVQIPVVLMGYMNPILQYGFEKFCQHAAALPIDGLILPDLPEHEFETLYGPIMQRFGIDFIFLVTPETSEERVRKLDSLSTGFLYAVSSSSTTGKDKDMQDVTDYLKRLQTYQLKNPVLVGFGIKDKPTFDAACQYANGAIIGSAYIQTLKNGGDIKVLTQQFISSVIK